MRDEFYDHIIPITVLVALCLSEFALSHLVPRNIPLEIATIVAFSGLFVFIEKKSGIWAKK